MILKFHSYWFLALGVCAALSLNSCAAPRTGPKLIEADGTRYTACGGAIWTRNDGNLKDPATMNYDVILKDREGANHELKMVHALRVTDLPDDTPACAPPPRADGTGVR